MELYSIWSFHVLIGYQCVFPGEKFTQIICAFLIELFKKIIVELLEFFMYSRYQVLMRYMICNYFLLIY